MVQIINQNVIISGSGDANYYDDVYINGNVTISGSGDIYFRSAFINGAITISGSGNITAQRTVIARKLTMSGSGDAEGNYILIEKCTLSGSGEVYGKISAPEIDVAGTSDYPERQVPFHQRAHGMYGSVGSAIETGGALSTLTDLLTDLFNQPFEILAAGEWNARKMQTASVNPGRGGRIAGHREKDSAEKTIFEWVEDGNELFERGQFANAVSCYDRALKINPKNAGVWFSKGNALDSLGRYDEAIACFDRVIGINPNNAEAWYNKGNAVARLDDHSEAISCNDRAIEINPRFVQAWNNKGYALNNSGLYNEALPCFDRAIQINPNYAYAWNGKGLALGALGHHSEALTCFSQALEIDPNLTHAKKNREVALRKIAENERKNKAMPPRSGETRLSSQSADPPVKAATTQPSITIERTVYDPVSRAFIVSTARPLVNVRNWIDRHDPASYWLVVCVHNHDDHPIDEWGITLEASISMKIVEAGIEGADNPLSMVTTHPEPWLTRSMLGISHHRGIVIPRNGSRRVYFRIGSESCGVVHGIGGTFTAPGVSAPIRTKEFQHSCDVATLEMAMQQNQALAMQFAEGQLLKRHNRDVAWKYLHIFKVLYDIKDCCHRKKFECVHDKLPVLENALEKGEVSDDLVAIVKRLNALDVDDGMGGTMLELKAREAERMCDSLIDLWKTEAL